MVGLNKALKQTSVSWHWHKKAMVAVVKTAASDMLRSKAFLNALRCAMMMGAHLG